MKQKLKFRFHNPNGEEETVEYLTKVLVQANLPKLERAIRESENRVDTKNMEYEESLCR